MEERYTASGVPTLRHWQDDFGLGWCALSGMNSGDAIARLGIPDNERYVSGNKVLS